MCNKFEMHFPRMSDTERARFHLRTEGQTNLKWSQSTFVEWVYKYETA